VEGDISAAARHGRTFFKRRLQRLRSMKDRGARPQV